MSRTIVPTTQLATKERDNNPDLNRGKALEDKASWVNNFLGSNLKIADKDIQEVSRNFDSTFTHAGLIYFLHAAWAKEKSVEFRPDMVWHTVINEFATMILQNPEVFRSLFTTSGVKEDLLVYSTTPILDVRLLIDVMKKKIASVDFLESIYYTEFSSAPENARYVSAMVLACAGTPYFNYMMTMCGIPSVEIVGSLAEWKSLKDAISKLASFVPKEIEMEEDELDLMAYNHNKAVKKLKEYFTYVNELCDKFVFHHGSRNAEAVTFYSDIFHYGPNTVCGSGHAENLVKGWARKLYLVSYESENDEVDLNEFPGHVCYVPYTLKETMQVYVQAGALSHSVELDNGTLSPQYGIITFIIDDVKAANKLINPTGKGLSLQLLHTSITKGRYFKPASLHYRDLKAEVQCNRCKKDCLEDCIGFEKYDFCMSCVNELVKAFEIKDFKVNEDMSDILKTDERGKQYCVPEFDDFIHAFRNRGIQKTEIVCRQCHKYNPKIFFSYNREGWIYCEECTQINFETLKQAINSGLIGLKSNDEESKKNLFKTFDDILNAEARID